MDERTKLIQRIYEQDKRCEKIKGMYFWFLVLLYVIISFAILYFVFLYNKQFEIGVFFGLALISAIIAFGSYGINMWLFGVIINEIREENERLDAAKKRLLEYDKEHNIKNKFELEDFILHKHL